MHVHNAKYVSMKGIKFMCVLWRCDLWNYLLQCNWSNVLWRYGDSIEMSPGSLGKKRSHLLTDGTKSPRHQLIIWILIATIVLVCSHRGSHSWHVNSSWVEAIFHEWGYRAMALLLAILGWVSSDVLSGWSSFKIQGKLNLLPWILLLDDAAFRLVIQSYFHYADFCRF